MTEMDKLIASLRREYAGEELDVTHVSKNPLEQFQNWFVEAIQANVNEANAMSLATADAKGKPSIRVVLLKSYDENGFVFFTNYESKKGKNLSENNQAAINFFWPELFRQIRIEGKVIRVSEADSDAYFSSRPYESKVGAWASKQSTYLENRQSLENTVNVLAEKYKGSEIPRPENWGGFCLNPDLFEFWQGRHSRLHDRIEYTKVNGNWNIRRLYP